MEPHENYLKRNPATLEHQRVLCINADAIDECVNFGTQCLIWCTANLTDQNSYDLTPIMLIRHVIETLDSISVLYRQGCVSPSEPLLRSLFEATLGINYILKKDTKRRALAYQITNQNTRLSTYRIIEKSVLSSNRFNANQKNKIAKIKENLVFSSLEISKKLENKAIFEIKNEWDKMKAQGRTPNWFSLFGGPKSIEELARKLGYADWYDTFYRKWSTGVHATGTFNNIVPKGKLVMILGLRDQRNLQAYSSIALTMSITTYRTAIQYFVPEMEMKFAQWYVSNIGDWCRRLLSEEKLINISQYPISN